MSEYVGDVNKNDVVRRLFNTRKGDGTPISLAGTPAAKVYEDSTTTEFTGGVTLTVDFDGKTGLHEIKCDTSNAAYSAGHDYTAVLTAGTVDGVSVVGAVILKFSVGNRIPTDLADLHTTLENSGGNWRFKLVSLANILALPYEGSATMQDHFRLGAAVLYGPATGLTSSTPRFRDAADTKDRVTDTIVGGARATSLDAT